MKNIKLSFSTFVIISFVAFIGNLLLVVINSKTMDLWSYIILTGILPVIILAFLNTFLLKENSFKERFFPVVIISAIETMILVAASSFINVKDVIKNTNLNMDEFSASAIAGDSKISDFFTTWIFLILITFAVASLSKFFSKSRHK